MRAKAVAIREDEDTRKALGFLRRRRPTDGLVRLEAEENRRKGRILGRVQKLSAQLEREKDAWSRCVEGRTEAGVGRSAVEEVLGFALFKAGPPGWYVELDEEGWRTTKRYCRMIAKRTGRGEWAESPAWVAQLIANAVAPLLAADPDRIAKVAQRRKAGRTAYEVFIAHDLGGAIGEVLWHYPISTGEVVNCFLRDRAFMAALLATLPGMASKVRARGADVTP